MRPAGLPWGELNPRHTACWGTGKQGGRIGTKPPHPKIGKERCQLKQLNAPYREAERVKTGNLLKMGDRDGAGGTKVHMVKDGGGGSTYSFYNQDP